MTPSLLGFCWSHTSFRSAPSSAALPCRSLESAAGTATVSYRAGRLTGEGGRPGGEGSCSAVQDTERAASGRGRSPAERCHCSSLLSALGPFLAGKASQLREQKTPRPTLGKCKARGSRSSDVYLGDFFLSTFRAILSSSGAFLKCLKIERCLSLFSFSPHLLAYPIVRGMV